MKVARIMIHVHGRENVLQPPEQRDMPHLFRRPVLSYLDTAQSLTVSSVIGSS
ncbi:hypothetical protein M378DRAFT_164635 [Amanita muscaria Koide BX008]|uniref:Uncharacterized protein n=1 Tax=Amanita muscaria (strain Koide BX008) TaxID=946122 RepID=A0A0C2X2E1_AMAMK|nr:hypothetical protein M378DRAFT_164635 [Amanita muscaria Koide BX008]